jgi:alpha-L-rhamnosidase
MRLTVTGLQEPLTKENISIQRVGADFESAGSFTSSNPWLNTLHEVTLRTHRNYCLEFPMDPMREKQGWTQDMQNFFHTAVYLTDVSVFYRQWWRDMADNQQPNGLVGSIVPLMGQVVDDWNCPWWSGMIAWLPWEHYLYYGDRKGLGGGVRADAPVCRLSGPPRLARAGTRPLDHPDPHFFLHADAAKERLLIWSGANDWMHPDNHMAWYASTPTGPLVNMAAWYHYANIVSRTAALLGKTADAETYAAMARDVAKRTNDRYLDPGTGRYGASANDQTAQILPLAVGMVPPEVAARTHQRLLEAIEARKGHHAAGFVALPYLLRILAQHREAAVANRMINQTDYPSWKTLIHHGVLAENWRGGGAQMPSCGGAAGMWLYQSVLGIQPDPAGPGFKRFILAPQPDPATGLTAASGWYDSPYGRIVSQWKMEDSKFNMDVVIPPNTTATVYVPAKSEAEVAESGKPAAKTPGVKFLRMESGAAVYEVGSGCYSFASEGGDEI